MIALLRFIFLSLMLSASFSSALQTRKDGTNKGAGKKRDSCAQLPTFNQYVVMHDRPYMAGTEEFELRRGIFEQRAAEIHQHNCRNGDSWKAGVNQLTDRTDDELRQLRGWRGPGRKGRGRYASSTQLALLSSNLTSEVLPESVSYMHLRGMQEVQDQEMCGSCWAFAATTVLQAHTEKWLGESEPLSVQQLVSCVPNPDECGGTGGCQGATAELAFDYVLENGLVGAKEFTYFGVDLTCPKNWVATGRPSSQLFDGMSMAQGTSNIALSEAAMRMGFMSYEQIPVNEQVPLMRALVEWGPVAVSVSATYSWNSYESGIFSECPKDAIVNHAVSLIGYGAENDVKYWHIQNSWGFAWGEDGFIRLLRTDDEATNWCGWDREPEQGSGCKGGPGEVYVCGMCGILYDAVVPHFDVSGKMLHEKRLEERSAQMPLEDVRLKTPFDVDVISQQSALR